jgi:hypothetical protein
MSVEDHRQSIWVKLEVAKLLRISPDIVKFYLDNGTEVFNTETDIWKSIEPPQSAVRVVIDPPVELSFLQNNFVQKIDYSQILSTKYFETRSLRLAVFQKCEIVSDDTPNYIVLKPGDELMKTISDEKLNYFAIPLLEWSTNLIDLPCESSFQMSVNLTQFQFQIYEFYVDIPADQTFSATEGTISRIVRQEIIIDKTIPTKMIITLRPPSWIFSFHDSNHYLEMKPEQLVSDVERELSARLNQDIEIDRTQLQ